MSGDNGEVLLKVPKEIAEKLEKMAKERGISGRAPWAIYARMVLKEATDDPQDETARQRKEVRAEYGAAAAEGEGA